jgi:hypothetical protein
MNRKPTVRISAFPAHWLIEAGGFDKRKTIIWSTGQGIQPGDIQVFATSATLGDAPKLVNDPRRDSVHSIWEAITSPQPEYGNSDWPVQTRFRLLVKLQKPVPKDTLYRAGILRVYSWPRNSSGKILHDRKDVKKLAGLLGQHNPWQREAIFDALNV